MTGKSQINIYVPGLLLVVSFSHYKNYLHVIKETRKGSGGDEWSRNLEGHFPTFD